MGVAAAWPPTTSTVKLSSKSSIARLLL